MDYLAAPLTMLGVYLIGKKNKLGWISAGIGSTLWCVYAIWTHQLPLLALNLVFVYLDTRGYWLWSKTK